MNPHVPNGPFKAGTKFVQAIFNAGNMRPGTNWGAGEEKTLRDTARHLDSEDAAHAA